MQFGSLVHSVLERYGKDFPNLADREEIASAVLSSLEREIANRFGKDPSPAVRVQAEAARVRLLSFASVQAEQVAAGWKIVEAEYKSSGDLVLGGLPVSAMIDRIEVNGAPHPPVHAAEDRAQVPGGGPPDCALTRLPAGGSDKPPRQEHGVGRSAAAALP